MTNYDKIAELVINLTEINIFENRRTQSHVDARTLFDYIMNRVHKKTLESIADYYISKGKSSNHSTIYYRLCKFKDLINRTPEFLTWLNIIKNSTVGSEELLIIIDKIKSLKTVESIEQVNELLDKLNYKEKLYNTLIPKT